MGDGSPLGTTSGFGSGSCGVVVMAVRYPEHCSAPGTGPFVNEDDSTKTGGQFERDTSYIPDRITRGARRPGHGPTNVPLWPRGPGRSRLVAARACPWASRAIMVRQLLGLEEVLSLGLCGPTHD